MKGKHKARQGADLPNRGLLRSIDAWMFGKGSPVTLGLFRVVICGLAFINLAMIAIDFEAWFGEKGFVPLDTARQYSPDFLTRVGSYDLPFAIPRINLLAGVSSTELTAVFYAIVMMAALFGMIGLWTRVSTIVLALGMVSLQHRNLLILHGGDTALRQFLLIVAIAPSGAALSVDRVIAVWRGKAPPEPVPIAVWGQRLLQLQIAILYFSAVWWKWQGGHWRDGTATFYIHSLAEFDRFWVPAFMERQPMIAITTYMTLLTELSMATLVFYKPFRKWVLLAALGMHGYIEYRFNIPMFAFVVTSAYICFYEGEEVVAWARRVGARMTRAKLRVLLPSNSVFAGPRAQAIRNMDPLGLIEYQAGEGPRLEALSHSGTPRNPYMATWKRSLGAWPLLFFWDRILARAIQPAQDSASTAGSSSTS